MFGIQVKINGRWNNIGIDQDGVFLVNKIMYAAIWNDEQSAIKAKEKMESLSDHQYREISRN